MKFFKKKKEIGSYLQTHLNETANVIPNEEKPKSLYADAELVTTSPNIQEEYAKQVVENQYKKVEMPDIAEATATGIETVKTVDENEEFNNSKLFTTHKSIYFYRLGYLTARYSGYFEMSYAEDKFCFGDILDEVDSAKNHFMSVLKSKVEDEINIDDIDLISLSHVIGDRDVASQR